MEKRQLKLGAFIAAGFDSHPARGAIPEHGRTPTSVSSPQALDPELEAGKFDAFFMADHLAVLNMPVNALKRSHTVTSFEPFTAVVGALSRDDHIGLIATGSTTFDEPYHVARRFAPRSITSQADVRAGI